MTWLILNEYSWCIFNDRRCTNLLYFGVGHASTNNDLKQMGYKVISK